MRRTAGSLPLLALVLVSVSAATAGGAGKALDGAVNLNTAPPEVLSLLPGIGPAKAQNILAYRKKHPFRTVDELVRIKGIGRKMVRRIRPHLAVGGPTTATPVEGHGPAPTSPPPTPPPPLRRPVAPPCAPVAARAPRPAQRLGGARPSHGACATPP